MPGIENKVIVITGASSGIGEATARLLAQRGAKLMLGARREDRLGALKREIESAGGIADYRVVDVTQRDQVQALADAALEAYGQIDVMINNAGVMLNSPLSERLVGEWDRMVDVNIKGVLYGIAAVLPHMLERGGGHIINVSSVSGIKLFPSATPYCGTKFAVHALTEGLRMEVGDKIRVTILSPGAIFTELSSHISHQETRERIRSRHEEFGLPPASMARALAFAIEQPHEVDVNDMVIRPIQQEL